ncbi:hypothetical protein COY31_01680 [Candidatus Wolfebacteria bacterium CG_4_10_14_0_2_um_filter_39_18]|uniref:Uncharacterized protein n=1 Tax=Candidatus Wolfebacteria bacterium CG_4_10_14_0_2_um_filter_39_18 TaxID=1975061 RepID=A0A2M7TG35_9BACT|nr:MAG: hypothetical protein COY31_01680 [Candidatus Wolfebacteria bacterium CG_4_10_14_0_2_um_filter_39_18]
MATITIPKKLTKGEELIIISRKEYEDYLKLRKVIPLVKMTVLEKREWQRAKKDYEQGKYVTLEKL